MAVLPLQFRSHSQKSSAQIGFEWVSCTTDGAFAKGTVDTQITTDFLTWTYCHSVDVLALCSGEGRRNTSYFGIIIVDLSDSMPITI